MARLVWISNSWLNWKSSHNWICFLANIGNLYIEIIFLVLFFHNCIRTQKENSWRKKRYIRHARNDGNTMINVTQLYQNTVERKKINMMSVKYGQMSKKKTNITCMTFNILCEYVCVSVILPFSIPVCNFWFIFCIHYTSEYGNSLTSDIINRITHTHTLETIARAKMMEKYWCL